MRIVVFALTLTGLIVACANKPLPTTPEQDAPCGVAYVTCTLHGKPTGFCCDDNNTCCNGTTCPTGMCDYTGGGSDDPIGNEFGKRRHLSKQWRVGTK